MVKVTLVAGLGFGDEGKGTTVDYLARREPASLVVRYNGGAQAAHNVVAGGVHHTFSQLGSGTFAGAATLLSRHVLINPVALLAEAAHLRALGVARPLSRVFVEGEALVTTPFHVAANRLRESARSRRHGSCGMGIGETTQDAIEAPEQALRVADLARPGVARAKLHAVRARKLALTRDLRPTLPATPAVGRELALIEDERSVALCLERFAAFRRGVHVVDVSLLGEALRGDAHVVFEGAQGVLLDQDYGFQPHTTWTDITFANARELLARAGFAGPVERLGVLRGYMTRHGAGPFVTGDPAMARLSAHDHNATGEWQGGLRSGALDLVAVAYAVEVLGGSTAWW